MSFIFQNIFHKFNFWIYKLNQIKYLRFTSLLCKNSYKILSFFGPNTIKHFVEFKVSLFFLMQSGVNVPSITKIHFVMCPKQGPQGPQKPNSIKSL